jgi:hypothetical protein
LDALIEWVAVLVVVVLLEVVTAATVAAIDVILTCNESLSLFLEREV